MTDLILSCIDYVVKFNGGNNVGYMVVVGDEKYVFYLLLFGILTLGVMLIIGNGVVVDFGVLFSEFMAFVVRGVDVS